MEMGNMKRRNEPQTICSVLNHHGVKGVLALAALALVLSSATFVVAQAYAMARIANALEEVDR